MESVARCYNDIGSSPKLVDVIVELAESAARGHVDSCQQSDTKEYGGNSQNGTGPAFWQVSGSDFRREQWYPLDSPNLAGITSVRVQAAEVLLP